MQSVKGLRAAKSVTWIEAFGVVDRDNWDDRKVVDLREDGIFALDWYSVESIYYHPSVQERVAGRRSDLLGGDSQEALRMARDKAIARVRQHVDRIVKKKTTDGARRLAQEAIPKDINLDSRLSIPPVDVPSLRDQERHRLQEALDEGNLDLIIERYPIRETGALDAISKELGFPRSSDYEKAVLRLLEIDEDSRELVKKRFEPLLSAIAAS